MKAYFRIMSIISLLTASILTAFCQDMPTTIPLKGDDQVRALADHLTHLKVPQASRVTYEAFLESDVPTRQDVALQDERLQQLSILLNALDAKHPHALYDLDQFHRQYQATHAGHIAAVALGNHYYYDKKYQNAVAYYKGVPLDHLEEDQVAEISFKKGYALFHQKKFDLASTSFQHAATVKGSYFFPAQYYLGMCHFYNEKYDQAAASFHRASPSAKFKSDIPYYLVQIYFNQKDYQRVIDYGLKQIDASHVSHKAEIKKFIGKSYYELDQQTLALQYMEDAQAGDAQINSTDNYQLGVLYFNQLDYKQSINHLKEVALQSDEMGEQAAYYLSHAYLKTNQKELAASAFAQVRRQASNPSIKEEATYNAGLLSAELGRDREAVNTLMNIKASSDYYQSAQEALFNLFSHTKDYKHALSILGQLDTQRPLLKKAEQKLHYQYAKQLISEGGTKEAMKHLEQAISTPVNTQIVANSYYLLSYLLHGSGRFAESQSRLSAFVPISTQADLTYQIQHHYIKGYNAFKQSKYGEAKIAFTDFLHDVQTHPGVIDNNIHADALVRRGDCHFTVNQYEQSLQDYRQAYGMKSSNQDYIYYQIAMLYGLENDPIQKLVILEDLVDTYKRSPYVDDALLESGKTYLSLGQFDQAARPLQALVRSHANSSLKSDALMSLGLISFNKGSNAEAINYYKQVFEGNYSAQQGQDALLALQEIYVNDLKQPEAYITFVESVTGGAVTDVVRDSLNFQPALRAYKNAEYEEASTLFSKYIKEFVNGLHIAQARYLRGETYTLNKMYHKAYSDYKYIVDQGPGPYYEKALTKASIIAYNELQRFDEALSLFRLFDELSLNEEDRLKTISGAMRSAYRSNQSDATLQYAQRIIKSKSANAQLQREADYYASVVLYQQGSYDEALKPLNRLSELASSDKAAEARYLIAKIYWHKQELNIAEEMSRLAIKKNTTYPYWVAKSILLLSDILIAKENYFSAKAGLEAILEHFSEDDSITDEARKKLKNLEQRTQTVQPQGE